MSYINSHTYLLKSALRVASAVALVSGVIFPYTFSYADAVGKIDPESHFTKICKDSSCSSYSNLNWHPASNTSISFAQEVVISDTGMTGNVWGDEVGWVTLNPSGQDGVKVDPSTGVVSGYAYVSNGAWLNFSPTLSSGQSVQGVRLVDNGSGSNFTGWAFMGGDKGGWIHFDCAEATTCVKTNWRTMSYRVNDARTLTGCPNFMERLEVGSKQTEQIKAMQGFLQSEMGVPNPLWKFGKFDQYTKSLVKSFQNKYKDVILAPQGFSRPTGIWAKGSYVQAYRLLGCSDTGTKITQMMNSSSTSTTPDQMHSPSEQEQISTYSADQSLLKSPVCPNLAVRLDPGSNQKDVIQAVQDFLKNELGASATQINPGVYDEHMVEAVKLFQLKYRSVILDAQGFKNPTGIWGQGSWTKAQEILACRS